MKEIAIKENHLFLKAYTKGKKHVGKYVVIYILPDAMAARLKKAHPLGLTVNRIGLTATKKLGGAVQRNRCRRIMREGYRAAVVQNPVKTGYLIVAVARHSALRAKSQWIERDFTAAFENLGMISCKNPGSVSAAGSEKDINESIK